MGCAFSKNKFKDEDDFPVTAPVLKSSTVQAHPPTFNSKTTTPIVNPISDRLRNIKEDLQVNPDSAFVDLLNFVQERHMSKYESAQTNQVNPNRFFEKGTGYGYGETEQRLIAEGEFNRVKYEHLMSSMDEIVKHVETHKDSSRTREDLDNSSLNHILMEYFLNDSLLDIQNQIVLYQSILKLVEVMSEMDPLPSLFTYHNNELLVQLTRLEKIAADYLTSLGKMPAQAQDPSLKALPEAVIRTWDVVSKRMASFTLSSRASTNLPQEHTSSNMLDEQDHTQPPSPPNHPEEDEDDDDNDYDKDSSDSTPPPPPPPIISTPTLMTTTTTTTTTTSSNVLDAVPHTSAQEHVPEVEQTSPSVVDEDKIYIEALKDMLFDSVKIETFAYTTQKNMSMANNQKIMRLVMEINSLSTSLPLSKDSSIFVRVDEERLDVLKALIIGPQDTPYAGGCFEFDIYLPDTYPNSPPLVHFLTTGGGTARFNPNLYDNGKVCLSLLGTWSGGYGETWTAKSTLLQVLISIQSLILVPEPYFNEPGYIPQRGTMTGTQQSQLYDKTIRLYTLRYAIKGQLEKTGSVFYDVIKKHFALRKEAILKQVQDWTETDKINENFYDSLKDLIEA